MKKLYFCFILLFGLFAFTAQLSMANGTYEYYQHRAQEGKRAKEKYYKCLQEYKSKLPKTYKGPNLESNYLRKGTLFETDNEYFIDTELIYYFDPEDQNQNDFKNSFIRTNSVASTCNKEYVSSWKNSYYNVIDVPPGSCLKFIPETKEVKVISPTDKEYKNLVKYAGFYIKERVDNVDQKEQPNLKPIPNSVIFAMILALISTVFIEGLMALPFGWKFVGLVSLTNLITNPALNFTLWHYQITSTQTILLLECLVVLVEWGIFSVCVRKKYFKLFLFALLANAVSYLSGYFINF